LVFLDFFSLDKTEEYVNHQLQTQNKQFQELLHRKLLEHEKNIDELNVRHSKVMQDEQNLNGQREQHLKSELEFLKVSFHSYKVNRLISKLIRKEKKK